MELYHKNVHVYVYTMFYTLEMLESNDEYTYRLGEASAELPASLKAALYWSNKYAKPGFRWLKI